MLLCMLRIDLRKPPYEKNYVFLKLSFPPVRSSVRDKLLYMSVGVMMLSIAKK